MKFHVFSDLHLGCPGSWHPELAAGADAVLCAGDVCDGLPDAMRALRAAIPAPTPIVTVAGNHSFYGGAMDAAWTAGHAAATEHGITLLENDMAVLGAVRIVGATLWTDYALDGAEDRGPAMARAAAGMNDHRMIVLRSGTRGRFMPAHARELHLRSVAALDGILSQRFEGPTIVMTHHAPSPRSIAPRYQGHDLNPAFCSDLGDLIERHQPLAWIHGHMHSSADYRIGRTRVVNNPHGYGRENAHGFDRALVLDTEALEEGHLSP